MLLSLSDLAYYKQFKPVLASPNGIISRMASRQSPKRTGFYSPELDGLRFLAFLLVFIHNASPIFPASFLKTFAEYGWMGVDLFFCLSAFLITKLLVMEYRRDGRINIQNFYFRRILRIWPLYFFYVALASSLVILGHGDGAGLLKHIAGLATFTFNLVYFALLPSPLLIFIHLWSISYEEQFYAIIPWLLRKLLTLTERHKRAFFIVVFLLGSSTRALFIYFQMSPSFIYILPFTRFEAILGGTAIGLGLFDKQLGRIRARALFAAGVLSLVPVFRLPNTDVLGWGLMLTYPLVGIGMSLILFSLMRHAATPLTDILRGKPLAYLGKISYGLYVYHFALLGLASRICTDLLRLPLYQPANSIMTLTLGLAMTVLSAILSYRLVEKPFLRLKERFSLVVSRPI
jgi:peptidoglycan/LPS O-acetylase OafA/YrhL